MRVLHAGTTVYRTHARGRGPWWFGNSGDGRFDLSGADGTCYVAESELVSLLETWGGIRLIPRPAIDRKELSRLALDSDVVLADLTSNLGIKFGITAEVFATLDFRTTQAWAHALWAAGYGGVRYWARHDLAHRQACIALFSTVGDRTASHDVSTEYQRVLTEYLADRGDLLDVLESEAGILVIDTPSSL